MIHTLDEREFVALTLQRCRHRKEVVALSAHALMATTSTLLHRLTGAELRLLIAVLSLTIGSGRVARAISINELCDGFKENDGSVVMGGTGLSVNTVRSAVRTLLQAGVLNVYREQRQDGSEVSPRIYEINFKALDPVFESELTAICVETVATPYQKLGVPPSQKLTPPSYIHMSDCRHSKSSTEVASYFSSPAVAVETQQGETDVYVGKKASPVFASRPAGNAAAVAQAAIDKNRAKVSARATTASQALPGGLTRDGMQALFDKLYPQCGVQHRLMVTVKEFGFLRKTMKANPPGDLEAMLRFSLTYWPMLSQQNSRAVSKDGDKLVKKKSLPPAPHFSTFTYWYPYFLRAFQNHLAGRNSDTMKDEGDRKLAQVNSELERTRGMVTMLRRQNQQLKAAPAAPLQSISKPAVVRRRPVVSDSELPAWE